MRFLSLFSGIGGFDLGLERAGMECVGQVEQDADCLRILCRHWPDVRRWHDVKAQFVGHGVGQIDVIAGGVPCQDASVMRGRHGERKGIDGERTGLFWEVMRLAERIRPRWILIENVAGLLSADRGRSFGAALGAMDELGYMGEWRIVDGAAFGLPLRRDHLIIAALDRRAFGCVPEGFRLADSDAGDAPRSQLLEGTRQPFAANGRPVAGRDYRLLTPDECEIALGFPAGWTAGWMSDTTRYKQLGNAMAVPVAEWIGRRIMATEGA